jgi:hypothetical protein
LKFASIITITGKVGTKYKSDLKWLSHESRRYYIALLGGEVMKQIILLTGQEKGTDLDTNVLNLKTCSPVSCSTTFLVWQIPVFEGVFGCSRSAHVLE